MVSYGRGYIQAPEARPVTLLGHAITQDTSNGTRSTAKKTGHGD